MIDSVPDLFAVVKSMAEDIHGIAVDGLRGDNSPDMQSVLAAQLRIAIVAVNHKVGEIKQRLDA